MTISIMQPETRFAVDPDNFSYHRQYSQIYLARFSAAKAALITASIRKWKASEPSKGQSFGPPIRSLADLVGDETCVVIGTVFKDMKLKPSILRDIAAGESIESKQTTLSPVCDTENFIASLMSPTDDVFLEDDIQRIRLDLSSAPVTPSELVTGVVMAVLGSEPEEEPGAFLVKDVTFIEPVPENPVAILKSPVQESNPFDTSRFHRSGPWLAVVSGLGFTSSSGDDAPSAIRPGHAMALQLLADWLRRSGDWSHERDAHGIDGDRETGILRLMILGDSIRLVSKADTDQPLAIRLAQQARYLTRNVDADSVTAMNRFDQWLSTLPLGRQSGLSIDLLPGPADPTSQLLPQQPVHAAVLPQACNRSGSSGALMGRTNPYLCRLMGASHEDRGRVILATSGQGVNELARYTDLKEPCDRMEACLLWGHLAPTCPDTLAGYPLVSNDLMLLKTNQENQSPDYPDIFVAGCQPGRTPSWRRARLHRNPVESDQASGALLVAVPRFDVSPCLVLVHLEQLDCCVVRFDTGLLDYQHNV